MRHFEWKKILYVVLLTVLLLVLTGIGYFTDHFQQELTVEAGAGLQASDIWTGYGKASISGDDVDTGTPGVYETRVLILGRLNCPVQVTVQDTTAPEAETQKVIRRQGESCEAADFIASSQDVTAVSFSFAEEPDMMLMGTQQVQIAVTDEGNNQTIVTAELFIPSVRETVEVEIGEKIPAADAFLLSETGSAEYVSDETKIDTMKLGGNKVTILVDEMEYNVQINVVDTVAPSAEVEAQTGWTGKELAADSFVTVIDDMTAVAVTYQQEPDWTREGEQEIVLCLTDEGQNTAEYKTLLTLQADKIAPIINASDITVKVGKNISYKKSVSMTDNCDLPEELSLQVDSSAVNLKQVGDYKVTCTAVDTAGNQTEKVITVHVVPEQVISYDQATINQMADNVLSGIITPDMTPDQKCRAIFDWVKKNVSYINNSEKGNWLRGAYEGFKLHKGDCYVYYSTSRALLTRAGIPNLEIKKEKQEWTSQSNHYWNLVDLGAGWYHFDTTPRKDKTVFYMWTDAQLKEYSDSHKGSHNFTRELYPAIN